MGKEPQEKTGSRVIREFSSGGVVYKKVNGEILWLVRSTNPSEAFPTSYWMLPKGWIDNESENTPGPMASGNVKADETSLRSAALREVAEEGGIKAVIKEKIGTTKYYFEVPGKGKILKFVTFFLMEFVSDLPEGHDDETSEVIWLPYTEARRKLSFSREKKVLDSAFDIIRK